MNWQQIEGNWKQRKGKFRAQWGKLTGDDLEYAAGQRDRLAGLLEKRYGLNKEKAQNKLDEFIDSLESSDDTQPKAS